ncbi:class I SAM-dependent methyltransferase [Rivibacter subsaxonicus]|uniref:Methyltransferase family protein n=1 Tax=Rivibacter subsaxonicus TaxID=457575 RepID=A0A4Q7VGR7_9BURK|nr:class I SAM-dependent methyltransferase [Rivibacter subsaxonicus]RZT95242.1 methyltransferase family protein [Rivibacter subsaxonicus]
MSTLLDRHLMSRVRNRLGLPMAGHRDFERSLAGKSGLEIGGPSSFFTRRLPLYRLAHAVDQLNFSADTVWSRAESSKPLDSAPALARGRTIICDGTDLRQLPDAHYDFVLSCHNLEHIANPLRALAEWVRVIRPGGHLLLIVPSKAGNFDHRRPYTRFEHLLEDFERQVDEHDMTHLDEILALHDLSLDPGAGDAEQFRARSLRNFENRCLHHHVFDLPLVFATMKHFDLGVRRHATTPHEFVVLGQKP